ncbi:MAG: MFS transporter [Nitrospiraceae bacterium]|nr:MAG: MFS transporter [Nitrospiraceae bacterium]
MRITPFRLLCTTGLFAIFSSTISKSPVLPLYAAHLGADPAGVGAVASVSAFTGIIASMPAGMLSDKLGRKRMLMFSAVIFSTAPFLYPLASSIRALAAIRFYHGFATAIFIPVAMAMVSDLFQKERGEKLGWFSTATLAGRFLAPLAGGAIIGALTMHPGMSFTTVYLLCGVAGVMALALAAKIPGTPEGRQVGDTWAGAWSAFRAVIADRRIVITSGVEAAVLFAYGAFETFLPLYAVQAGRSTYEVGLFLSIQVITLALTKPVMGRFSDLHGRQGQICAGAFIGAAAIAGFSYFQSFIPLLILSATFGLSISIVTSATSAFIADLSRAGSHGSAMGILGSVMDVGHTAGPLVSGIAATFFGLGRAFTGAALVLVTAGVLFRAGVRKV